MSRVNDGESGQRRTKDSPSDSVSPQLMVTLTRLSQCSGVKGRHTGVGVLEVVLGTPSRRSAVRGSRETLVPTGRVWWA